MMAEHLQSWVLVAGGFHRKGGMDRCNWALARYLVQRGDRVHLVCHDADPRLAEQVGAVDFVPKPAGSFMLGGLLLGRRGREVARAVTRRRPGARVVVNGGNCQWPDINWVHYVHAAWPEHGRAPAWFKAKRRLAHRLFSREEKAGMRAARILIANSERTRRDVITHLGIDSARVHTIYLGCDDDFRPPTSDERAAARAWLGQSESTPLVVFVGALGYDSRKGMDVLFKAWRNLCAQPNWDANLIVAGGGRSLEFWRRQAGVAGLERRIAFAGFTERVPQLLAAADLLVSPARYEAYGLNVQEAICCGVPAMVTHSAGVAERYPAELHELLISDPEEGDELVAKLLRWRMAISYWREKIMPFSQALRAYSLEEMAKRIVRLCTGDPDVGVRSALGQ